MFITITRLRCKWRPVPCHIMHRSKWSKRIDLQLEIPRPDLTWPDTNWQQLSSDRHWQTLTDWQIDWQSEQTVGIPSGFVLLIASVPSERLQFWLRLLLLYCTVELCLLVPCCTVLVCGRKEVWVLTYYRTWTTVFLGVVKKFDLFGYYRSSTVCMYGFGEVVGRWNKSKQRLLSTVYCIPIGL